MWARATRSLEFFIRTIVSLLFLSLSFNASGNSIEEGCRVKYNRSLDKQVAHLPLTSSGIPVTKDYADKFNKISMSNQMLEESAVQGCVANEWKSKFNSQYNKVEMCPMVKSSYKADCFKNWIARQELHYVVAIPVYANIGVSMANQDTKDGSDKDVGKILLVDAVLAAFERYSADSNLAFAPLKITTEMRNAAKELRKEKYLDQMLSIERTELQKVERDLFQTSQKKIIPILEEKLTEVRDSINRSPSSDNKTTSWIRMSIKSLEGRVAKLKARSI
jgi:hypothetical protein